MTIKLLLLAIFSPLIGVSSLLIALAVISDIRSNMLIDQLEKDFWNEYPFYDEE